VPSLLVQKYKSHDKGGSCAALSERLHTMSEQRRHYFFLATQSVYRIDRFSIKCR